jgi:heme A synthase
MTRSFAVLPPGTVRGIDNHHQIIEIIHRTPTNVATTGALVLLGAGALLLAAIQLRRPQSPAEQLVEEDAREHGYPARPRGCRVRLRRVK